MSLTELTCPCCGNHVAFYSRRRSFTEKFLLPIALLRPYRCAECFERYYRSMFSQAKQPRGRGLMFETPGVAASRIDRVA
jgi:hypothetical protein